MKTLIIGVGCIGGTVATIIKSSGYDVEVVAHGEENARLIEEKGFTITGVKGDRVVKLKAYPDIDKVEGLYDIVIIATKYQQMPELAEKSLRLLKDDSLVVAMQNGLCVETLAEIVGEDRAVGCMIGFGATMVKRNFVNVTTDGEFYVGMLNGRHPPMLDSLREMLSCVYPTKIADDINARLYSKLIINSCINALAGISGKTLGEILKDKTARFTFLKIAREAMNVANAMNMKVPKYGALLEYRLLMISDSRVFNALCCAVVMIVGKKNKNVKPSTLQALEAGKTTEIDIMNGYISKLGKQYNVPTPVNDKLTAMIKQIENGERKLSMQNIREFD
ncbi:MAG: ketopantoate reductase family protein [Acutalibacteraceae bacterium]|nr:2-dehydropantoate 2-reductase [Oscillospiraceae bacterium]